FKHYNVNSVYIFQNSKLLKMSFRFNRLFTHATRFPLSCQERGPGGEFLARAAENGFFWRKM
ncbi:MAG: hypothetical protein KAS58_06675, partial [Calditrichia bacterium]|nr:hypothetical protein [Calditrichia bacterium]